MPVASAHTGCTVTFSWKLELNLFWSSGQWFVSGTSINCLAVILRRRCRQIRRHSGRQLRPCQAEATLSQSSSSFFYVGYGCRESWTEEKRGESRHDCLKWEEEELLSYLRRQKKTQHKITTANYSREFTVCFVALNIKSASDYLQRVLRARQTKNLKAWIPKSFPSTPSFVWEGKKIP